MKLNDRNNSTIRLQDVVAWGGSRTIHDEYMLTIVVKHCPKHLEFYYNDRMALNEVIARLNTIEETHGS